MLFPKFALGRNAGMGAARLAEIAAGWVGADVGDEAERLAQARFMQALLLAALAGPVPVFLFLAAFLPATMAGAAAAASAGACLAVAAILNLTGSRRQATVSAMALSAVAVAALSIATGGLTSVFLAWFALLPLTAGLARGRTMMPSLGLALCGVLIVALIGGLAPSLGAGMGAGQALVGFCGLSALAGLAVRMAGGWNGAAEARQVAAERDEPAFAAIADRMAGLVTLHDPRGAVTAHGGLDAKAMLAPLGLPDARRFADCIHVSDRLVFAQALDRLRQGDDRQTVALRLERRDGSGEGGQFVHVAGELAATRDAGGALLSVLAQWRDRGSDIAEKAALSEALRAAESRAESAAQEKTRFLAAVSHEMRTPLNAILGFSEILSQGHFGPLTEDRQREYIQLIHESGEHLLALVNTMLDMSKIETGSYQILAEPFAVDEAVRACERMLALQAANKGLTLTARITKSCGMLNADRRAVQQILINLIGNAVKFTEAGGVVTIDAERRGAQIRLTVGDTGIGMEAGVLERLGQPFVQGGDAYARRHQGTGLGLCLVKGLVALHGGRMAIDSQPGRGTSVTVELPADGPARADGAATARGETVEFPPRLKTMEHKPRIEDGEHGATAAKTA